MFIIEQPKILNLKFTIQTVVPLRLSIFHYAYKLKFTAAAAQKIGWDEPLPIFLNINLLL